VRAGDNLFTDSMIAFHPKTGEWAWYYQTTPNDPFDYDGINALVLAEIPVNGTPTKVIIQANRSGIFYVVERATGKLVAANPYVKVTWTEGIDKSTGRPIPSDAFKRVLAGENVEIWPSGSGGTNWYPMSFSPQTGLAYVNTMNLGTTYRAIPAAQVPQLKVGGDFQQVKRTNIAPEIRGYLNAIDPLTGKSKWQIPFKSPNWSGTLVTASNIVFSGTMTGDFIAVDAQEGQVLWRFQTSSGIIAPPVTWEQDGKQMLAVLSGIGGVYSPARDPGIRNVPKGGSLWAFRLMEE
jgi:alcohol dehydrogenase (cytochrome c)